ncbi:MAG: protein kinase [Gemmataceae bacterium]|nr:protein kinase [Gemmataceae bacterium]
MRDPSKQAEVSSEEFVQNLGASGIFAGDDLGKTIAALPAGAATDARSLATFLTSAGALTPFQAEAVLAGRIEELVLGNYEVLARLGAGAMGTVFKARHRRMKRIVAIKVLSRAIAQDPTFLQRFQREVETVARLNHPNIVMAFDADEADVGPFLVMEFVNGCDLASKVQKQGSLPLLDAVDCILQAAHGLAYAHGQGMVHRDIKPANLLQDVSGMVKVADLGLARFNDPRGQNAGAAGALTQAGSVVGTVDFMAPEQAMDSTAIDHRADIYSLGCTLYYLLTGKPPYVANTLMAALLLHRDAPVPCLCAARPEVPAALNDIFQRMMAKQPGERCASLEQVIPGLEAIRSQLSARPDPAGRPAFVLGVPQDSTWERLGATRAPGQAAPELKPTAPCSVRTVLLVEPSRTQAVIVRKYLQELGVAEVQAVPSGAKALESIRSQRPDLVLSAMHLADITGVELARRLRAEPALATVGFVLISSETDIHDASALEAIADTVLLRKPFDQGQLDQALRQAVTQLEGRKQ